MAALVCRLRNADVLGEPSIGPVGERDFTKDYFVKGTAKKIESIFYSYRKKKIEKKTINCPRGVQRDFSGPSTHHKGFGTQIGLKFEGKGYGIPKVIKISPKCLHKELVMS